MESAQNGCFFMEITFPINAAGVQKNLTFKVELNFFEQFCAAQKEMGKIDSSEMTWPAYSTKVRKLFSIPGVELIRNKYLMLK